MDLKNIKQAMHKHTFQDVQFDEKEQQAVHTKIQQLVSVENLKYALLGLTQTEKSGFELTELMHMRGEQAIYQNEGLLYQCLHELEVAELITGLWKNGEKVYFLSKKGQKQLALTQRPIGGVKWKALYSK
ncbi:helix-turn-helix transcriptional regulator [Psychrobacillus sp. INOP01]|uniref:helix-turn-helix transcriptional regulator n=1 Tax=Psychrobacillus sp. INOP01 TaxID=2829187 RepID=UPI001BA789A7|nr:helix-turn-helix transcriptional regulator [Psychrobacillus sp. INOP01]QUG42707.1 helix-turn-helix transcriptional regulator [Psychrobacillus sp. INOP01]